MNSSSKTEAEEFASYLRIARQGLIAAMNEPNRFQPLLEMIAEVKVERALDVGCGIGQMLYPFVALKGAHGVGLDPSPEACCMGNDFYATHVPSAQVRFVRGQAERLPFASDSFDLVNLWLGAALHGQRSRH